MRTYRHNCGVREFYKVWFGRNRLTEASACIVFYDSAHPTYLETFSVHLNVAQIWVVPEVQGDWRCVAELYPRSSLSPNCWPESRQTYHPRHHRHIHDHYHRFLLRIIILAFTWIVDESGLTRMMNKCIGDTDCWHWLYLQQLLWWHQY